jgi:hypothetical protein
VGAPVPPEYDPPHAVIAKQGRYVRIQLLDKNYLSLAEIQVMGVDPLRFAKVDYSSTLFIVGMGGALI